MTIKAILREEKAGKDGLCPVAVCVTYKRQRIYRHLGIKLLPAQFDNGRAKASVKNQVLINATINKHINEIEKELLTAQLHSTLTMLIIKSVMTGNKKGDGNFHQSAKAMLDEIKQQGKDGTHRRYDVEYRMLQDYSLSLTFADITPVFLTKYHKHMLANGKDNNTTINAFKYIRRVFNYARSIGVTDLYPFDEWTLPKYLEKDRGYLTKLEIDSLQALLSKPLDATTKMVTAFFLLECYSGIRHSDWGNFSVQKMLDGENMILRTTKTGTRVTIPIDIYPSLKWVIDYIRDNDLVFKLSNEKTNVYLKAIAGMTEPAITRNLTTHIGRHTFAVLMLEKGFSKELIAELMGVTTKVVSTYAKYTSNKARSEFERLGGI